MPATSRQPLSGTTRSAMVLAGSPSKSMIFQPSGVCRVWPRWKSPCTRWVLERLVLPSAAKQRRSPGV